MLSNHSLQSTLAKKEHLNETFSRKIEKSKSIPSPPDGGPLRDRRQRRHQRRPGPHVLIRDRPRRPQGGSGHRLPAHHHHFHPLLAGK